MEASMTHVRRKNSYLFPLPFVLIALSICFSGGCGGGSSTAITDPYVPLATLEDMQVDHLSYYAEDELDDPSIEVWVMDGESDEQILCASSSGGMNKVITETLLYGDLGATFQRSIANSSYQGRIFKIQVWQNEVDDCVYGKSADGVWPAHEDVLLGEIDPEGYAELIANPVMATNGGFYIRLKDRDAASFDVPQSITGAVSSNSLYVDQAHWNSDIVSGDDDGIFETEVHIVDATSGALIACAGENQDMDAVMYSGLVYGKLLVNFVESSGGSVRFPSFAGRMVKVALSDNDDDSPCPSAIGASDAYGLGNATVPAYSEDILFDDLPGKKVEIENTGYVIFSNGY